MVVVSITSTLSIPRGTRIQLCWTILRKLRYHRPLCRTDPKSSNWASLKICVGSTTSGGSLLCHTVHGRTLRRHQSESSRPAYAKQCTDPGVPRRYGVSAEGGLPQSVNLCRCPNSRIEPQPRKHSVLHRISRNTASLTGMSPCSIGIVLPRSRTRGNVWGGGSVWLKTTPALWRSISLSRMEK
jgi:hypothetical protein